MQAARRLVMELESAHRVRVAIVVRSWWQSASPLEPALGNTERNVVCDPVVAEGLDEAPHLKVRSGGGYARVHYLIASGCERFPPSEAPKDVNTGQQEDGLYDRERAGQGLVLELLQVVDAHGQGLGARRIEND